MAAGIVALAAGTWLLKMTLATADFAIRAWPLPVALAVGGLLYAGWRMRCSAHAQRLHAQRLARLRITLAQLDALDDQEFEAALRDLLIRDGWSARRVGKTGDQAADVIARHQHLGRAVLQAKHTRSAAKVGSSVMYQVKGTARPVHRADHAVVVTNGGFTRDAKRWGERHQVHWVDRDKLRTWAEHGVPLQELLRLPAPCRGRPPSLDTARSLAS